LILWITFSLRSLRLKRIGMTIALGIFEKEFTMKYQISISLLALFMSLGRIGFADDLEPVTVDITPQAIFVPNGFDDNDDVTVVIDGYLPDTCYRLKAPIVQKDPSSKTITVQPQALRFPGVCQDVIVPFTTAVSLGAVPNGSYKITTRKGEVQENVYVKKAVRPGPDDYLYAPVDTADVQWNQGKLVATIRGRFTENCLSIEEMRVINSGKTLELLPIMKREGSTPAGEPCQKKEIPFEKKVSLPTLASGRYLLHVRSLNGQAVNHVFTNPASR
jgi:hypothetical protein